ncbi:MAG TPA: HupE/UreJ family protein [Terriglobales bacterium]|nr:HupE/UreJ family protein [Terriglobales bacterium]
MRTHVLNSSVVRSAARLAATIAGVGVLSAPALAHATAGQAKGLVTGFIHPLSGLDHILAMVAVGIWGAQLKRPAIWVLPIAFPMVMSIGGLLGVRGVPIPGVEIGVAASAVVLGIVIAAQLTPPLWVAGLIVSAFAIFHGHAHGTELPKAASPLSYALGFVLATGLLHATGIVIGLLDLWPLGARALRIAGGFIAATGVVLLVGLVGHA